jgi:hypothetical protein
MIEAKEKDNLHPALTAPGRSPEILEAADA